MDYGYCDCLYGVLLWIVLVFKLSDSKIMKANIIFFLVIFIISALCIGHFRLTFSPFTVSLPYWHRAVGIVLIVIGCLVYNIGENVSGYKKGLDKGIEIVLKQLKEKQE